MARRKLKAPGSPTTIAAGKMAALPPLLRPTKAGHAARSNEAPPLAAAGARSGGALSTRIPTKVVAPKPPREMTHRPPAVVAPAPVKKRVGPPQVPATHPVPADPIHTARGRAGMHYRHKHTLERREGTPAGSYDESAPPARALRWKRLTGT